MKTASIITALVSFTFLIGCGAKNSSANTDKTDPTDNPLGTALAKVRAEFPARQDFHILTTLSGTVAPIQYTRLAAANGGRVESLLVAKGDPVKAGMLLAKVAAKLAHAQLKQAEAAFSLAHSEHKRSSILLKKGHSSTATMERNEVSLTGAAAQLELAQVRYKNALITAPHDGTIARKVFSKGEQVPPGATLYELVNIDSVKVETLISEREIAAYSKGDQVSVSADAWPDEKFSGSITEIDVVADPNSRTFGIAVEVSNPKHKLKPGMFARVTLVREKLDNVLTIRSDALIHEPKGAVVFTLEGKKAVKQHVRYGGSQDGRVVIFEGLSVSDNVVVEGQRGLVDGQKVIVIKSTKSSMGSIQETTQETAQP